MDESVGLAPELALGKRLQQARRAAGLTQQSLCQQANLSYSTLAKIERGAIKSPSIFTVQSIAAALNTSLDSLVGVSSITAHPTVPTVKRQSKSGVKFVYFDVNGCLVRFFQKAFTHIASDYGMAADAVETAFWHYNDEVCRGTLSVQEFGEALARRLQTDYIDWEKYYIDALDPMPGMAALVQWAADNYYVGLLTNIMPGALNALVERGLLPDVAYDAVIDSSVAGTVKPEPAIYDLAAAESGVQDDQILFIDDSRANLITAEKRGWHVLWFDDYEPEASIARIRQALEF